jgi:hypothetical protein
MPKFGKKSGWTWGTSASVSASIKYADGEKGHFVLKSPSGQTVSFNYVFVGAGASTGWDAGLSWSTEDYPSDGDIWIADTYPRKDLTVTDFEGMCLVQQFTASAGAGGAITAMLLGVPASQLVSANAEKDVRESNLAWLLSWIGDHPFRGGQILGGGWPLGLFLYEEHDVIADKLDRITNTIFRTSHLELKFVSL